MKRWVKALGYADLSDNGRPSFSKMLCAALAAACIWQGKLTIGTLVALLTASFGRSMWKMFLRSRGPCDDEAAATSQGNTENFVPQHPET